MNMITTAFIVLSLCGLVQAQPATPIEEQDVGSKSGEVMTEDELLGEGVNEASSESATAPQTDASSDGVCANVFLNAAFIMYAGTKLQSLYTSSILECCSLCQDLEVCTTWTRDRNDGACELYEMESLSPITAVGVMTDMGGFIDAYNVSNITEFMTPLAGVDTIGTARVSSNVTTVESAVLIESLCSGIRGATYPMGNVIVAGDTRSAQFCCDVCWNSNDCVSWYFNEKTNHCVLNRNVPEPRQRSPSRFEGGTVWN